MTLPLHARALLRLEGCWQRQHCAAATGPQGGAARARALAESSAREAAEVRAAADVHIVRIRRVRLMVWVSECGSTGFAWARELRGDTLQRSCVVGKACTDLVVGGKKKKKKENVTAASFLSAAVSLSAWLLARLLACAHTTVAAAAAAAHAALFERQCINHAGQSASRAHTRASPAAACARDAPSQPGRLCPG
jgi:hypothetical protein